MQNKPLASKILKELSDIFSQANDNDLSSLEKQLREFRKQLQNKPEKPRTSKIINVFQLYNQSGADGLRNELSNLSSIEIRKLIKGNAFANDSEIAGLETDGLIGFLIDKVIARMSQGKAFREPAD